VCFELLASKRTSSGGILQCDDGLLTETLRGRDIFDPLARAQARTDVMTLGYPGPFSCRDIATTSAFPHSSEFGRTDGLNGLHELLEPRDHLLLS